MKSFDPIATIERACHKAADMQSWWAGVAETVAPELDRGLGMYAYTLPLDTLRPHDLINLGAPQLFLDMVMKGAERPERRDAVRAVDPAGLYASTDVFGDFCPPAGIADAWALSAPDGEGALHVLVVLSPRRERTPVDEALLWRRLALHIGAGVRLQRQGGTLDDPEVEAVLSPGGKLIHANSEHTDAKSRERLREMTRHIDRLRGRRSAADAHAALELWQGLLLGRWSMVEHFDTDGRRFLVARRNDPDAPAPRQLTRRQRQVAFYASLGLAHKQVGYALGLEETTVASHLHQALQKLGIATREDLIGAVAQIMRAESLP